MISAINSVRRYGAIALLGLFLCACVRQPDITLVNVEVSEENSSESEVLVTISSSDNLDELARRTTINLIGSMHICDHESRYRSVQYLSDSTRKKEASIEYVFTFPASLQRLVVHPEGGGEITSGWPRKLASQEGVCFQIRGGKHGEYVRSEVVELTGVSEGLTD